MSSGNVAAVVVAVPVGCAGGSEGDIAILNNFFELSDFFCCDELPGAEVGEFVSSSSVIWKEITTKSL